MSRFRDPGVVGLASGDQWKWLAAGLLALHAVLAWVLRDPGILTAQDDAHYLVLAEGLRDLQYRDSFRVDAPAHTRYPPVYPAVLAIWGILVADEFDRLVALNILLSTAGLGLLYRAVSRTWSPVLGVAMLAPIAVNASTLDVLGEVRSEALYFFLTAVALWALAEHRPGGRMLAAAGVAALLGALTRSIGVAIVVAVALHWILERRKVAAPVFLSVSALTVGGWLLWTAMAPEQHVGRSYVADFAFRPSEGEASPLAFVLVERMVRNASTYLYPSLGYHLGVPNIRGVRADNVAVAILLATSTLTGLVVLWKRWRIAALYLATYGGILLIWPWTVGRFVVPLLPLLMLAVLLGLGTGARWIAHLAGSWTASTRTPSRWPPWITPVGTAWTVVLAFALATTLWGSARTVQEVHTSRECARGSEPPDASCVLRDQASFFEALRYISQELPEDAVILSAKPEPLHHYTRRLTAPIDDALRQSPDGFLSFAREHGTGYVLLGSLQQAEIHRLPELLEPNCRELALVREFPPRTYLLRLRVSEEPPGDDGCDAVAASRRANVHRDFVRDP